MKRSCPSLILLVLLAAISVAGQTTTKPRPTSFIESRQGNHPNGPDMIGHKTVSHGDALLCMLVEVYDGKLRSPATACVIRFGDGPKHSISFNETFLAQQDSEAYLECAGDKPRRCMVEVNPPPTKESHVQAE